jgi:hypothetical protein
MVVQQGSTDAGLYAWGGIETVGEGLERAVRGGSATASTTVFRAAQER